MIKNNTTSGKRFLGAMLSHELYDALKNRAVSENRSVSNMLSILITDGVNTKRKKASGRVAKPV